MPDAPTLSVIIPVYNEAESLPGLGVEVLNAMTRLGRSYEILLIDDGSTDRSWDIIKDFATRLPGFTGTRLGRNFGQTAALAAGISAARGEVIACLDADLQNDPRDIAALLVVLDQGYDVVSGWRRERKDPWLTRRLPSQAANLLISWITGVALHDYGCTLKLYRSRYLKPLRLYGEMHRFIPALAGSLGARVGEAEVTHRPRALGRSKYGLGRTFKVVLDLLTVKFMDAYLGKPIYLFGGWGLGFAALGACLAAITLYKKFFEGTFVKDQPLFQISIFFGLIGFQLVLLGLLAEVLVRVYFDIKDKPGFFVAETTAAAPSAAD